DPVTPAARVAAQSSARSRRVSTTACRLQGWPRRGMVHEGPRGTTSFTMRLALITLLTTLFASTTAFAAPATDRDADSSANKGKSSGTTVYDFDDDNVDGELLSPEGANVASRGRTKHASLITIRPHSIPELIKMANDV